MKKIFALALAICLVLCCFVGCSTTEITNETKETEETPDVVTVEKTKVATATVVRTDICAYGNPYHVNYFATVISDDYYDVIEITKEQFCKFKDGEIVTIFKDQNGWVQIEEFNSTNKFFMEIHDR